jgi:hypothetical protein
VRDAHEGDDAYAGAREPPQREQDADDRAESEDDVVEAEVDDPQAHCVRIFGSDAEHREPALIPVLKRLQDAHTDEHDSEKRRKHLRNDVHAPSIR